MLDDTNNGGNSPLDRFAVGFCKFVINWRWVFIILSIVVAVGLVSNARFLTFGNNYRVFFSDENPELLAFENLQDTYTKNDNMFFMIRQKDRGDVFNPDTMAAVAELTEEAWQLPFSIRVDSVTNFQHTYAEEDDLIVEDLILDVNMSEAEYAERREIALAEPLIRHQLVNDTATATAVNVTLQYPEEDPNEVFDAADAGRELRAKMREKYPELDIHLSGVSMLNNAFSESGQNDFSTLVPTMFLIVLVLMIATIRSVSATLSVLLMIVLSIFVAIGAAGMARIALTPISLSSIIVILTLAVADSVHVLIAMRGNMRQGMEKRVALLEAVRVNFLAIGITSLTTIVGFLALNFSDAPPFKHLGNMAAVGIFAAWWFSITFLPAMISLVPFNPKEKVEGKSGSRFMERLGRFVVTFHVPLAILCTAMGAALIVQIPKIQLNDQWTEYFSERIDFRSETDVIVEEFGLYTLEFSLPAAEPGGISEPDYLHRVDDFAEWLRQKEKITHVYALSDIMKRLNKNLNGDDESFYRLPEDREMSAQYLLLYELSLPYGLDLNDRIDINKSATRLTATLTNTTTSETKALLADIRQYMEDHFPVEQRAQPTSAQVMFTYIAERNINQMIQGTIVAVILISVIMIFSLRSLSLGLLSLIPNALPILSAFGIWALLFGEVGFSISIVAAISLGIVVDDTVHMMTKYLRARREKGLSPDDAIVYAFSNVGLAIFVNTVILAAGFSLLLISTFKVTLHMGLLTTLSITFALIYDFFLLPALLKWTDRVAKPAPEGAIS